MALAYVSNVVYSTGPTAPPGPAITYNGMDAGSTMVVMGVILAGAPGVLSTSSMITSITDAAGNAWQYSTAATTALTDGTPPAAYSAPIDDGAVAFVAWCAGGLNPGSIQFEDATGATDYWYLLIIEVSGVLSPNLGRAATGTSATPSLSVPLGNYGDLTCAAGTCAGGFTVQPPGMTYTNVGINFVSLDYDVTGASMGTAAWTQPSSQAYAATMMSFNAVPEYPPVPPLPGMISS